MLIKKKHIGIQTCITVSYCTESNFRIFSEIIAYDLKLSLDIKENMER